MSLLSKEDKKLFITPEINQKTKSLSGLLKCDVKDLRELSLENNNSLNTKILSKAKKTASLKNNFVNIELMSYNGLVFIKDNMTIYMSQFTLKII